ncbi:hypothetical protein LXL04_027513 [Taraxacum kok-saghyz]
MYVGRTVALRRQKIDLRQNGISGPDLRDRDNAQMGAKHYLDHVFIAQMSKSEEETGYKSLPTPLRIPEDILHFPPPGQEFHTI